MATSHQLFASVFPSPDKQAGLERLSGDGEKVAHTFIISACCTRAFSIFALRRAPGASPKQTCAKMYCLFLWKNLRITYSMLPPLRVRLSFLRKICSTTLN